MGFFLTSPRRQAMLQLALVANIPTQQQPLRTREQAKHRAPEGSTSGRSAELHIGDEERDGNAGDWITMPMRFEGGSYVVDWKLDGKRFSGVVDTGSPFLTVSGSCGEIDTELWGCLDAPFNSTARREKRMLPPTYEVYGLQEDGLTDWLRGEVVLNGIEGDLRFSMTYGASEGYGEREGSAPGSIAPMFGLVRDVAKGIRPSFLSQTSVTAFTIDFENSEVMLRGAQSSNRGGREGASLLPLVDLRPIGAPAFEYACEVDRLVVNGYDVDVGKPIYAIFDTGTTGMLVSRRLWEKSLLSLGVAQCAMEVPTVDGQRLVVAASTRSCRKDCLLVARPIDVLWQPPESELGPSGPPEFEVIFVGLAFLTSRGYLTVDLEQQTIELGPYLSGKEPQWWASGNWPGTKGGSYDVPVR